MYNNWFNSFLKFLLIFYAIIVLKKNILIDSKEYTSYNCTSVIIADGVYKSIDLVKNCTIIRGSIVIHHFAPDTNQNITNILSLPNLREITDYLIVFNVSGIENLGSIFPNLTLIRGKTLFNNYALAIYENPDLVEIGLKSLLAIPRGHVFIDHCPKLCNVDKIFWNRLTLSRGSNYAQDSKGLNCSSCQICMYFWDSEHCQFFEGYDLVNRVKNNPKCHSECFGGCFKEKSNEHCNVCKNFKEGSKCVSRCSKKTYANYIDMHCYSADECIQFKEGLLLENEISNECVTHCPYGFKRNDTICIQCSNATHKKCLIKCPGDSDSSEINSISQMERYKGCHLIKTSITIRLLDPIDDVELEISFGDIRIIKSYLRVYDSPYIQNLKFFKNLEEIEGTPTYNGSFSILVYQNKNLTQLWSDNVQRNLKLGNGGIYIDSNPKLCNRDVNIMQKSIEHKRELDFIFYNDEEVYCNKGVFDLKATAISRSGIALRWTEPAPSKLVEIFYRELTQNTTLKLDDDLDKDVCLRTSWIKIYLKNYNSMNYNITNLRENIPYAFILKIFTNNSKIASFQSVTTIARTMMDLPVPPRVYTMTKLYNMIVLTWNLMSYQNVNLTKIVIEVYRIPDNPRELNTRNFCQKIPQYFSAGPPLYENELNGNEKACLYGKNTELREDDEFEMTMRRNFRCTVEKPDNCDIIVNDERPIISDNGTILNANFLTQKKNFLRKITIRPVKLTQTVLNLQHATLYLFKVYFCNRYGCGGYTLYSDETNGIVDGNLINNFTIIQRKRNYGADKYSIKLEPPRRPNGAIIKYQGLFEKTQMRRDRKDRNKTATIFCYSNTQMKQNNFTIDYDIQYSFTILVSSTADRGYLIPLRGIKDFDNLLIIDEIVVSENGYISVEIIITLIILGVIIGISYYSYRKYPKFLTRIYYTVEDDRINLITEDQNEKRIDNDIEVDDDTFTSIHLQRENNGILNKVENHS